MHFDDRPARRVGIIRFAGPNPVKRVEFRARTVNLIETERLFLEPVDASRLDEFVALTADADTMRYWGPGGAFSSDDAERNFGPRPGGVWP